MTVKEIATFTSRTERTVRNWIKKATEKSSQGVYEEIAQGIAPVPPEEIAQGIAHDYSLDEVEFILEAGSMGKDTIGIVMENARTTQSKQNAVVDYNLINHLVKEAVKDALGPAMFQMTEMFKITMEQKNQKVLAAPKISLRSLLVKKVENYARLIDEEVKWVWITLHRDLKFRCHINVKVRAKNEGVKPLDIIEREGLLEIAIAVLEEFILEAAE